MTILLMIIFWMPGFEVVLDAERMYDVTTLEECEAVIPDVKDQFIGSKEVYCFVGDITNPVTES